MRDLDRDAIINEAIHGTALREIARSHALTLAEVRSVIDDEAAHAFSGEQLRREWWLEASRLRALGQRYFDRAMSDDDMNAANAAAIYIKASERLSSLTGLNAPQSSAVTLINATPPAGQQSSTARFQAVIDRLLADGKPRAEASEDQD